MRPRENFPQVNQKLEEIEEEFDVEIFFARDFGSTAWNLDSEKSDRDVGFIFKQPRNSYLEIGKYKENIDKTKEFNGIEHTFQGWNYKRFFSMVNDSNPMSLEVLRSPIKYRKPEKTAVKMKIDKLRKHVKEEFSPIGLFYHYKSLSKKNYRKYIQRRVVNSQLDESFPVIRDNGSSLTLNVRDNDGVYGDQKEISVAKSELEGQKGRWYETTLDRTIKRNIYAVRGILYARYVAETHKLPNLDFKEFANEELVALRKKDVVPREVERNVQKWVSLKRSGQGSKEVGNPLGEFIEKELDTKLDNPQHNIRGVEREKVNSVIRELF